MYLFNRLLAGVFGLSITRIPSPSASYSPGAGYRLNNAFHSINGSCQPTGYYAWTDAVFERVDGDGTIDVQMNAVCRATCDSQPECLSYVGVESPNRDYSSPGHRFGQAKGTCYFYAEQLTHGRPCEDDSTPLRTLAYFKWPLPECSAPQKDFCGKCGCAVGVEGGFSCYNSWQPSEDGDVLCTTDLECSQLHDFNKNPGLKCSYLNVDSMLFGVGRACTFGGPGFGSNVPICRQPTQAESAELELA